MTYVYTARESEVTATDTSRTYIHVHVHHAHVLYYTATTYKCSVRMQHSVVNSPSSLAKYTRMPLQELQHIHIQTQYIQVLQYMLLYGRQVCTHLGIVEERVEYLIEEYHWREQEIQQSQHSYPKPQSRERRGNDINRRHYPEGL